MIKGCSVLPQQKPQEDSVMSDGACYLRQPLPAAAMALLSFATRGTVGVIFP